jgi:hypothetical protein
VPVAADVATVTELGVVVPRPVVATALVEVGLASAVQAPMARASAAMATIERKARPVMQER